MLVTTQWMYKKYWELNKKLFNSKLPQDITCKTSTNVERWGWAQCEFKVDDYGEPYASKLTIIMSNAYDSPEEVKENTLVHEMIHIFDYYLHPHYYVYKDYKGWHHRKGYDAHGPIFFLKEAQRLQQYGYNIQRLVSAEEYDVSQLTDKVIKRQENKKAKGFVIGFLYFNWKYPRNYTLKNEGMWFKTSSPNQFNKIVEQEKEKCKILKKDGEYPCFSIVGYLTHQEKYDEFSGCRGPISGWYCSVNDWEKMVEEMGKDKQLIGQFYFEDINESYQPQTKQLNNQKRQLTDGENGIGKMNADGSLTYIMM